MRRPILSLVTTAFLAATGSALLVTDDSPCDQFCGNVLSSTTEADIVCKESDYGNGAGIVFESCIKCQLRSTYSNGNETDLQWLLYNLRYTISQCLFNMNGHGLGDNPCVTSTVCGPLKDSFEYHNLTTKAGGYDFCGGWDEEQVPKCSMCLLAGDMHYINNFVTILDAACQQKPETGVKLSLEGEPFSTIPMNVTTPSAEPTWTFTPHHSAISGGGIIGIVLGGVVFLLTMAGCGVVCVGRRRRRAYLKQFEEERNRARGWPAPNPDTNYTNDTTDTPMSQKPLHSWEDSPTSAHTDYPFEKPYTRYFSPYSSQYNSPVSAAEGPSMPWPPGTWPTSAQEKLAQAAQEQGHAPSMPLEIGIALGGDDPSIRSKPSNQSIAPSQGYEERDGTDKGYNGEAYEMHQVDSNGGIAKVQHAQAPVLQHPGYGRNNSNSPTQTGHGGLTEEDAWKGGAI